MTLSSLHSNVLVPFYFVVLRQNKLQFVQYSGNTTFYIDKSIRDILMVR